MCGKAISLNCVLSGIPWTSVEKGHFQQMNAKGLYHTCVVETKLLKPFPIICVFVAFFRAYFSVCLCVCVFMSGWYHTLDGFKNCIF